MEIKYFIPAEHDHQPSAKWVHQQFHLSMLSAWLNHISENRDSSRDMNMARSALQMAIALATALHKQVVA